MNSVLDMRSISKSFAGVKALSDVSLSIERGEIHALVGENGAGKSTLMKILSGVYPSGSYGGDLYVDGAPRHFKTVRDSEALGIVIIHQELALIPLMSIAENIAIADPPRRFGVIDRERMYTDARAQLAKVGLSESPDTAVHQLGTGKQQLVEIAKALSKNVSVLILDEPTASLNERDSDALLALLVDLKAQGVSCILISHKLNEVSRVADRITVLRDGKTVDTIDCRDAGVDESRIIRAMVDRDLDHRYPKRTPEIGETVFKVTNWSAYHPDHPARQVVRNVDFQVRRGEIVGIAGLMGAGRTEFAMSLFGRSWGRNITGTAAIDGRAVDLTSIPRAIAAGLAYVTEDRKELGLLLNEDIRKNVTLAALDNVSSQGVLDDMAELKVSADFRDRINIRCASVYQQAGQLSGGNQQKVVLSKWLFTDPKVLILDEPTRGIDVGAKYEIYCVIQELARDGRGIIVISSEMPELLGICDRICVMNAGAFVGEFSAADASQEKIMGAIMRRQDAPS